MLNRYKELTIVRLKDYIPEGLSLDEHLSIIEREQLPVTISYEQNPLDTNAKIATLPDGTVIGLVNADCHRYLKAMLEKDTQKSVTAEFVEVQRRENHSPVIIYKTIVDLEKVEKLEPGEEWNEWNPNIPDLNVFSEMGTALKLANMLSHDFTYRVDNPYFKKLITKLEKACIYDMSVELTEKIDDICFFLEGFQSERMKEYRTLLQHASTMRRTEKNRKALMEKWWPKIQKTDNCKLLWIALGNYFNDKYNIKEGEEIPQSAINAELKLIDKSLKGLPYNLYEKLDDIDDLFSRLFYTRIPAIKQKQLLTMLIIREKLGNLKDKRVNIAIQLIFSNTYNFYQGSQNIETVNSQTNIHHG